MIEPKFRQIHDFSEGKAAFQRHGRTGFINTRGEAVILPQYEKGGSFEDGLALVTKDKRSTYINHDGEVAFDCPYPIATGFQEGRARVAIENGESKWGYIDTAGKLVIPCKYDGAPWFFGGLANVRRGDHDYFIDLEGNEVFQVPDGLNTGRFSEGLVSFWSEEDRTAGFLDRTGKIVIGPNKDWSIAGEFSGGLAWVLTKKNGFGYINKQGEYAIQAKFRDAEDFSDGLAPAALFDGLWGYVDRRGEFVIKPKFGYARKFRDGLGYVRFNGKWGYVDRMGEYVWSPSR